MGAFEENPKREVVVVSVAVVEKSPIFDQQFARRFGGGVTAIPSGRRATDGFLERRYCLLDVFPLLVFGQAELLDPTPSVAADVPIGSSDGCCRFRVALERERAGKDGQGQLSFQK